MTATPAAHVAPEDASDISVALCMLTLLPGVAGGSEICAVELARALRQRSDCTSATLVNAAAADAYPDLATFVDRSYGTSRSTVSRVRAMGRGALGSAISRRRFDLDRFDVMHYPLTVPIPAAGRSASVITLHDLQHLRFPQYFSALERHYRRLAYHRSARRATRVMTSSHYSADSIAEDLGVPRERIDVAYLGVDHAQFSPSATPKEPFLYYPANAWPHKNHERLFEAFREVRRDLPELRLVLTGAMHERLRLPPGAESLGYVSRADVAGLYRRASALVYPSLFEGFGLPPIEAMASGCPVVASDAGSLGEICGTAARRVDPLEPSAIAQGIRDVLARPDEWVDRGIAHAAGFTWEAYADEHLSSYRRAAAEA